MPYSLAVHLAFQKSFQPHLELDYLCGRGHAHLHHCFWSFDSLPQRGGYTVAFVYNIGPCCPLSAITSKGVASWSASDIRYMTTPCYHTPQYVQTATARCRQYAIATKPFVSSAVCFKTLRRSTGDTYLFVYKASGEHCWILFVSPTLGHRLPPAVSAIG